MKKRVLCLVLGIVMIMSQTMTSFATTTSQLQKQKKEAEKQLSDTNAEIDALSEKQTKIQAEIDEMDADMVDLMIRINTTKTEIQLTENNISETEADITAKETDITNKKEDIETTKAELQVAEENRDQQYNDMKTRIQYMYENGGSSAWMNMILDGGSITNILNRVEYAQSMHDYDRESLSNYMEVVDQVTELKDSLEHQKNELESQKTALEAEKTSLESQKKDLKAQEADLESQQDELDAQIEAKKAASSDYKNQIAQARQQAEQISDLIAEQTQEIQRLEEEARRQAEEEARRQAEEEARRQAEAERQQQSSNNSSSNNSSNTSSNNSYNPPSGKSGQAIVNYALQFVGNPYVWGGNSLTNGIDCSHFVYQVLKNCGVYSGGYVTSYYWRTKGTAVPSLAQAQAGDVICYNGHVAIYDGNGMIVEAKGSKWGITHDRRANYSTIYAIRRFV